MQYSQCPKCKEYIDHLNLQEVEKNQVQAFLNKEGNDIEIKIPNQAIVTEDFEFECPECGELLFSDFEETKRFLQRK